MGMSEEIAYYLEQLQPPSDIGLLTSHHIWYAFNAHFFHEPLEAKVRGRNECTQKEKLIVVCVWERSKSRLEASHIRMWFGIGKW